jgi:hypothetical protein
MTGERKQIERTAAYAHRALARCADFACQQGPQDPRIINPGYPESPSRPRGRREATGHRRQVRKAFAFVPQASSLKSQAFPKKGQESELIISPIQLLSGGGRERRVPLKSTEDSENAVGIAPMALPLDLAMRGWDSWPKAVELTGKHLALPCQSTILQRAACGLRTRGVRLERFTA